MKKRFCLSILAAIILSLVIPICSAPPANATIKTPTRANLPELVQIRPWDNTIYMSEVYAPRHAKTLQFYIRPTGKYVKTVKKNTKAYKKYKKNQKKYIVVKDKKRKNRYMVYKAGKWKLILTKTERLYELETETHLIAKYTFKDSRVYQLRVRGKNYSLVGKYSKILQFKTPSKKTRELYIKNHNDAKELRGTIAEQYYEELADPNDIPPGSPYLKARDMLEKTEFDYGYTVYVTDYVRDCNRDRNFPEYDIVFIPKNPNGRIL